MNTIRMTNASLTSLNSASLKRQTGLTTLILSSILLFATSMIVLFTSKSAIIEQKVYANTKRLNQASIQAENVSNRLIHQFNQKSQNYDLQLLQQQYHQASAQINSIISTGVDLKFSVLGKSEDLSSNRDMAMSLQSIAIAGNGKGKISTYPVIVRKAMKAQDNIFIQNSFSPQSIWAGKKVALGQSSNSQTFIKSEMDGKMITASGLANGNNIDILEDDFTLARLTADQFFENFINESKWLVKHLAIDQDSYFLAKDFEQLAGRSGLIWIGDGASNVSLTNTTIGTAGKPAIVVADATNGTLFTRGKIVVHGLLYVIGNWDSLGEIEIHGAVIVEGDWLSSQQAELVKTEIFYQKQRLKLSQNNLTDLPGSWARVNGTWKDF